MVRTIFISAIFVVCSTIAIAQPTREELGKQKQQLKNDIEQLDRMRQDVNGKTRTTLSAARAIGNRVNLQERVIETINRDIDILDNNISGIQKDIHRYDRLLDTLKQEYAKSMVYAYKNRDNYEFLNFIFSAESFNDAIKRISYLKSYRNYREMQGENILRMQELRKKRIEALGGVKEKKNDVLDDKSKEMDELERQKQAKDNLLADLKKQGKQLNAQYAAKKKQFTKVNNAINAAIKKEQDEARIALADAKKLAPKTPANPSNNPKTPISSSPKVTIPKKQEDFPLSAENEVLNEKFENNRGSLPWPIQKGYILMNFGNNKLPSGTDFVNPGITFGTDIGTPVKAVFTGTVTKIFTVDEMQVVMIQHGRYFTSYSNLSGVSVQQGQTVSLGQVIGKAMSNDDGIGEVLFIMSNEKSNFDPERWLKQR